ncbi:ABC transporter ATP-binding protein [Haloglomus litoreum]|uniref:ABC transporter ATP-binding protein n=1 Tax=Haloglomus litoreum TaxID=3034026 RepID=UPI0023E7E2B5|nr:ABC transporter ATP-binding protein [Haloglomus sp. DT116]
MSDDPSGGASSAEPALELADVTVRYGDRTVLDEVSLSVRPGEFLALVGPNGAGKTTLLRTVNGLVTPESGTVRIGGTVAGTLSVRERARRVATVPQETSVGFDFPVRDLVAMGRTAHRSRLSRADESDRAVVQRALDRTDTEEFADRAVGSLSGGERQRVVLARALAQAAPLLLLDEPTASLDINHQVRVLGLVRGLVHAPDDEAATGDTGPDSVAERTAVAAIHDLDLAARFCDRIALLADGEIRAVGPPEAVLDADRLQEAYGVETVVTENTATGTPTVTALGGPTADGAEGPRAPLEADDD